MKYCAKCKCELPTGLDEYGDMHEPVCQQCFLDPGKPDILSAEDNKIVQDMEEQIEDLKKEIDYCRGQIDDLMDQINVISHQNSRATADDLHRIEAKLEVWKQGLPTKTQEYNYESRR